MDKIIYLINLYDYYGQLLTLKQKEYFEDYYFDNLSLKEISENKNVSRNAAYKQIVAAENKLINFEEKLKEYSRANKIKKLIENLDDDLKKQIEELL